MGGEANQTIRCVKRDGKQKRFFYAAAIIGTVPYMSPEQVRGEAVDGRSDIFSFAVVLYEMVSGQQPFASNSSAATASAILTLEPAPLARFSQDVPAELERIVSKCLRKDADDRYQTGKDLLIDVRNLRDELEFHTGSSVQRRASQRNMDQPRKAGYFRQHSHESPYGRQQANAIVLNVQKITAAPASTSSIARLGKTARSRTVLIVLGALILAVAAGWFMWRRSNVNWAKAQVPKIEALAQAQKYFEAYDLAVAAQKFLPEDATITRLMPIISHTISVKTDPAGAQVYLRRFVPEDGVKSRITPTRGHHPPRDLRSLAGSTFSTLRRMAMPKRNERFQGR